MKLLKFKEYVCPPTKVLIGGGAQIIDSENEIVGVTYGAVADQYFHYEEYDFKNNRSLFQIKFSVQSIYKIHRLLELDYNPDEEFH